MPRDDSLERARIREPHAIHVPDPRPERRMMQRDDRRHARPRGERPVEPFELLVVQPAAALARDGRIEGDDAHGEILDRVIDVARALPQVRVRGKCGAQVRGLIVVSRHEEERHRQRLEDAREVGIFLRAPEIREVAGEEHRVGPLRKLQDVRHAAREEGGGVDHAIGELAARLDVHVGDLREEEASHGAWAGGTGSLAPSSTARWMFSPRGHVRRSDVSTINGVAPPASTTSRVWSPRKKEEITLPSIWWLPAATMRTSSGRNITSRPSRTWRFMVPMKSATNAVAGR